MPILRCYVDDDIHRLLESASEESGRAIEELAAAAIESAAIEYKVDRMKRSPKENASE